MHRVTIVREGKIAQCFECANESDAFNTFNRLEVPAGGKVTWEKFSGPPRVEANGRVTEEWTEVRRRTS